MNPRPTSGRSLRSARAASAVFATALLGLTALGAQTTLTMPQLNRSALDAEDVTRDAAGLPARFAVPHEVKVDAQTGGRWSAYSTTQMLWQLRVRSPGANHINLGFSEFQLSGDAKLTVAATVGTRNGNANRVRPFTAADNNSARQLWTPVILSDDVTVQLIVDNADQANTALTLTHIGSGYRYFGAGTTAVPAALLGSGSCNIDVTCPQGAAWQDEIPAVAAYSTGGSIFCTGFMVNNTAQDRRNLFMTAAHCGVGASQAPSLVVYWNYENSSCGGNNAGLSQFNTGAVLRASYSPSDFTLVELNSAPNPAWGITYAGWNRGSGNASSAVAIHHPSGDSKKISFENQGTTTTSYSRTSTPGNGTHVRVIDWDQGTTEGGSSGSPLFDQNHRVIGQLHGGGAACGNNLSDWYGRVSVSWNGGGASNSRLSNWLDPLGTGQITLDTFTGTVAGTASVESYGAGCYETFASYYEEFGAGSFDLSGNGVVTSSLRMTRTASGSYSIAPGGNQWRNPTSADLNLSDDDLSAALSLPFTLAYPGGSTTSLKICSNGFIWLDPSATSTDFSASSGELLAEEARLCPFWTDLNPADGGSIHFEVVGGVAYCSWIDVPEFRQGGGANDDVQCAIFSDGSIEYRWRRALNSQSTAVVGLSPGNGATDPMSTDLSTATPFNAGTDRNALTLSGSNRPVLGSTFVMSISNIPAGSLAGGVFISTSKIDPGIDLGIVGMPGCLQLADFSISKSFAVFGPASASTLAIPNDSALTGVHIYNQAATISPGQNALGVLTSNGIDLTFGPN